MLNAGINVFAIGCKFFLTDCESELILDSESSATGCTQQTGD